MTKPRDRDTAVVWSATTNRKYPTHVITLKSGIRRSLGWDLGTELDLTVTKGGALVIKEARTA